MVGEGRERFREESIPAAEGYRLGDGGEWREEE